MQSGIEVGHTLERAVGKVRRQLDDYVSGLHELDQHLNDLVARRGGALLDLARHYLPDMQLATIQRTFAEVRDDLLDLLARKQRRERDLRDQSAAAERAAEHQEAELARVTEALNAKVAEREKLETQLAERLHGSEEFTRLSQQALEAEQELQRNEARVDDIKREAAKKLPPYDQSRLFRYLYDAGYGTPRYQATGWTRRIDAWVARMIDFAAARRGYDYLRVTPELMQQEVTRRRDRFNELMQQVETIEDRVSDEIGLTAVMRAGQELGAQRDAAVGAVAKVQDELLARQQELLKLAGVQNEFYEQALARMQSFLASLPPARLAEESRTTPEREDDAIVAEVSYLSEQLQTADQRSALLARERQAWDERLGGLQTVLQRFRQAEFDSRRSLFAAELDAEGLAAGYIAGQLGAADLWSALQRAQRFAPEWHEQRGPGWDGGGVRIDPQVIGDVSQVLIHVLGEVAGAAMRGSAQRGVERRAPTRTQQRQSTGRPPFPKRGGFTNGRGF
jgi:chromosome segregation ATPase